MSVILTASVNIESLSTGGIPKGSQYWEILTTQSDRCGKGTASS
jgi:hypothetical protein